MITEIKTSQAAYNIKKLTLIFLKFRREVWAAVENDLKHNCKPRRYVKGSCQSEN